MDENYLVEKSVPITIRLNLMCPKDEEPDTWNIIKALESFIRSKCRIRSIGNFHSIIVNIMSRNPNHISADFEIGKTEIV